MDFMEKITELRAEKSKLLAQAIDAACASNVLSRSSSA